MTRKRSLNLRCPICKKKVRNADPEFPFCSEHCRLVDLGKWASGAYVISSPVQDTGDGAVEDASDDPSQQS